MNIEKNSLTQTFKNAKENLQAFWHQSGNDIKTASITTPFLIAGFFKNFHPNNFPTIAVLSLGVATIQAGVILKEYIAFNKNSTPKPPSPS